MKVEVFQPIEQKVLEYKKSIHKQPEVGWAEVLTTAYVLEQLNADSLINGLGPNKTGAVLEVGNGSRTIFVRADLDALRTSGGAKHLCGHSTHTAALMGAYHWMKGKEADLNFQDKKVLFIFQPAEEVHPSGARTFLETYPEILSNSEFGFAIHVAPNLPNGTIQIQKGPVWAAHDSVRVEVTGTPAHVKNTPQAVDAIAGAAQIVLMFRSLQKDFNNFGSEVVFNFNTIKGGVANNTVADIAFLTGAVRWVNKDDHLRVIDFFDNLPSVLSSKYGGQVSIQYVSEAVPPCINDEILATEIAEYMGKYSNFSLQSDGAVDLGVEDFAHYSKIFKTVYTKVGVQSNFDLHDPEFEVSDEATLNVYLYWKHLLEWWLTK